MILPRPYNGLANSTCPLPIARNQSVTGTSVVLSRAELGCLADVYGPKHAPLPTETPLLTHEDPKHLATRAVWVR